MFTYFRQRSRKQKRGAEHGKLKRPKRSSLGLMQTDEGQKIEPFQKKV